MIACTYLLIMVATVVSTTKCKPEEIRADDGGLRDDSPKSDEQLSPYIPKASGFRVKYTRCTKKNYVAVRHRRIS
jgi:hypothetical protein